MVRKTEEHLLMAHSSNWRTKSGDLHLLPIRSKNNLPRENSVSYRNKDRRAAGFRVSHENKQNETNTKR